MNRTLFDLYFNVVVQLSNKDLFVVANIRIWANRFAGSPAVTNAWLSKRVDAPDGHSGLTVELPPKAGLQVSEIKGFMFKNRGS